MRRLACFPNGTWILVVLLATALSSDGVAQRQERAPPQLAGVGVSERLDAQIPLDLSFRDERGRTARLGQFFGDRPVILALTYANCPMLCQLQLAGLVQSLQDIELLPGRDFEIVNVSIDPGETPERALITKRRHIEMYGRPETAPGWHFLTGQETDIQQLAEAVGFGYQFVAERNEYAHAAALMIATPEGKLSRYLYGVVYPPQTVKLAVVEAGQGKIGSTFDQVLLFCFHFDASSGRYAPAGLRIMQLGGSLTLVLLLVGLVPFWLKMSNSDPKSADGELINPDHGTRMPEETVL